MPQVSLPPNYNGNGRALGRFIGQIPPALWVFLIGQLIAVVIWSVKLEGRVTAVEVANINLAKSTSTVEDSLSKRIDLLDTQIRQLAVIQERQDATIRRLDTLEQRLNRAMSLLGQLLTPQQQQRGLENGR